MTTTTNPRTERYDAILDRYHEEIRNAHIRAIRARLSVQVQTPTEGKS